MNIRCEYKVLVTDDVRKENPVVEQVTVKAENPMDAMERILKSRPPYTGVCLG